jgi:tetratricopeptide (TPR) repeat protein
MNRTKKLPYALILLLVFSCAAWSVELRSDFDAGQRCYEAGDFKNAVFHFKKMLAKDPNHAGAHFWLAKSYENLADMGGPLVGLRASSKARAHLARALQLAPANQEYRREYFAFLTVSDHSPGALREAEAVIQKTPRSDPDYPFMSLQLQNEYNARLSPEGYVEAAFGVLPRSLARASLAPARAPQGQDSLMLLARSAR